MISKRIMSMLMGVTVVAAGLVISQQAAAESNPGPGASVPSSTSTTNEVKSSTNPCITVNVTGSGNTVIVNGVGTGPTTATVNVTGTNNTVTVTVPGAPTNCPPCPPLATNNPPTVPATSTNTQAQTGSPGVARCWTWQGDRSIFFVCDVHVTKEELQKMIDEKTATRNTLAGVSVALDLLPLLGAWGKKVEKVCKWINVGTKAGAVGWSFRIEDLKEFQREGFTVRRVTEVDSRGETVRDEVFTIPGIAPPPPPVSRNMPPFLPINIKPNVVVPDLK